MNDEPKNDIPKSIVIARSGIETPAKFVEFASALIADILEKKVKPQEAMLAIGAGKAMLRMLELTHQVSVRQAKALPNGKVKSVICSICDNPVPVKQLAEHKSLHYQDQLPQ